MDFHFNFKWIRKLIRNCMAWSFITRSDPMLNSPNVNQSISHGVVFYTFDCKSVDIWKARPANDETKSIVTPNTHLWKLKKKNWIIQFNLFFESNKSYLLEQRSFQINQRKERSLCRNKPNMNGVKKNNLGNCPPTPALTQQQSIDNKLGLMLG